MQRVYRGFGPKIDRAKPEPRAVVSRAEPSPHSGARCLSGRATAVGDIAHASLHICTNSPVAERTEADLMRHTTCQGSALGSPEKVHSPTW